MFHGGGWWLGGGARDSQGAGNVLLLGLDPGYMTVFTWGKLIDLYTHYLFAIFLYIILNKMLTSKEWDSSINPDVEQFLRCIGKCRWGSKSQEHKHGSLFSVWACVMDTQEKDPLWDVGDILCVPEGIPWLWRQMAGGGGERGLSSAWSEIFTSTHPWMYCEIWDV